MALRYFHNEKKSVEPHLLHEFADDFYDEPLRLMLCGFIRPEKNFPSLGEGPKCCTSGKL